METPTLVSHLRLTYATNITHYREGQGQKILRRRFGADVSVYRLGILIDHVKAWTVLGSKTSLEETSFTQLDPCPLLTLRFAWIDAEEKELHSLLTANFDTLSRFLRCQIEVQLTRLRTNLEGAHEETVNGDTQFKRLVLVDFA